MVETLVILFAFTFIKRCYNPHTVKEQVKNKL
jgi:hypothetical protein